ncbi:MAG: porin [Methylomonas lenta]|nr:porin [Methylomonas lenta]
MKLTKLSLAMASALGAGLAADALAMDLYVDTKTQQIFAEPGRGRVLLGEFQKVGDTALQPADSANLKAEIDEIKQDLALKNNELKALDEHIKVAEETKVTMSDKGLQFESADKDFKFELGGRLQTDADFTSGDGDLQHNGAHAEANDGTDVRRARLEFGGTFYKDWETKTVVDFAENKVTLKDAFIGYNGFKYVNLLAGQQKQLFSRELLESSNNLMFEERSLMDVLNAPVVDRAIGLSAKSKGEQWTAGLGIFGDSIQPPVDQYYYSDGNSVQPLDEGWGVSSRVTYAPIQEKTKLIHLGLSGNYRAPDANGAVSNSKGLKYQYYTNHMSELPLISTAVADVNNIEMVGVELAGMYGPFYMGGEYTSQWVGRNNGGAEVKNDGWYVDAAWTLTGESRQYKDGLFKYLKPKNNFSLKNGTWGAFELATRWSGVTIDGASSPNPGFPGAVVKDTNAQNMTVALNWYMNKNFRFMADYSRTFDLRNSYVTTPNGSDPDAINTFMLRSQMAF